MIRWLFIALIIYMIYRLIAGPKRRRQPMFTFRFGRFPDDRESRNTRQQTTKKHLDHIEDAEYEDITEKDSKQ